MHAGERPQYANGLMPAIRRVMREEGFLAFWKVRRQSAATTCHVYVYRRRLVPFFTLSDPDDANRLLTPIHGQQGNGTSVLHRFPYAGINFFCYERFKEYLAGGAFLPCLALPCLACLSRLCGRYSRPSHHLSPTPRSIPLKKTKIPGSPKNETPFTRLVAGACAGGVACSACYPLDLIRTRLTIQDGQHKEYASIVDAFRKIARREGGLGLYKGLGTTLMVAVPNLSISYCIYGTMKEFMFRQKFPERDPAEASEEEPHFADSLVCGATSGIVSSLITYPADVLRRRLQVRGLQNSTSTRTGEAAVNVKVGPWLELKSILRAEGPRGLYRGLVPEILKVVPMVATTFTVYEKLSYIQQ